MWDRLEVQNEELVAAVQQLKPKARFIVTGYVLKGKTFKELAQETKLTERAAAFTYYFLCKPDAFVLPPEPHKQ